MAEAGALTDERELKLVKEAIAAILTRGASSYSIAGVAFTSLDLATLYERQRVLEARIAAQAGTRRALVARFRQPGG